MNGVSLASDDKMSQVLVHVLRQEWSEGCKQSDNGVQHREQRVLENIKIFELEIWKRS